MEEIWRDIAGYEGLYQVSNFGNVRSLGRLATGKNGSKRLLKGRILKLGKDRENGYLQVKLCKEGNEKTNTVHRLVAQAFLPNPYNLPEVNHIDEDKTNNCVENLEWCDHTYNMTHGTLQERSADARRKKPLQLTLDGILVKEWDSIAECGRNGFNQGAVSLCCNNKYGSEGNVYKGFRWVKKEDYEKQAA